MNGASQLAGRVYYIIFWLPREAAGDRTAVHPEHIAYVKSLEKDGRLLQAGPFLDDEGRPDGRGMFVLRVGTRAEAEAIAQADPYYKAGFRNYQIQPWRRSEGSVTLRLNIAEGRVEMD